MVSLGIEPAGIFAGIEQDPDNLDVAMLRRERQRAVPGFRARSGEELSHVLRQAESCGAVEGDPGTTSLQNKYRGSLPAALEDRTDLTAEVVKLFVRNGVATMPQFRKTELSDADVEALGAYLTKR